MNNSILAEIPIQKLPQPKNMPIDGRPWGLKRSRTYILIEDYIYQWTYKRVEYRIKVPMGFLYDGASVPRGTWTISGLRPDGLIRAAATVHDFLYEFQGKLPRGCYQKFEHDVGWVSLRHEWTREACDKIFGRLMRDAGMPRRRRRMAYRAVDWFGKKAWNT